ncbi:hypothetical protein BZG36_00814 [Bifiguratus adelaidae]|uniref:GOLD domain-containing protein n=1 Tax=Bifiguratus adelaidae TaxID=1938954 RepID=A0A261Y6N5_9FUNG|nr:hypothetical protein BZG36_00814 [Bifiguratus adelaidae]
MSFQVSKGGNLDIDAWVMDPADIIIKSFARESSGSQHLTADKDGRYTYCFSNQMGSAGEKTISFNAHGQRHVVTNDADHIDPLERVIRDLAEAISDVKDEQEFIVVRERQHRNTAESTNARVKWWSLLQLAMLAGICLFQVFYLRQFFKTKRV